MVSIRKNLPAACIYCSVVCCAFVTRVEKEDINPAVVEYHGNDRKVGDLVESANKILADKDFYAYISQHDDFSYTGESPKDVADWMKESNIIVRVRLYTPADPNTSTTAYVSSKYPNTIFLNSYKLNRGDADIVNTIIHEVVHSVDASVEDHEFGHGGNSRDGKQNSAPYWIGQLAECLVRNGKKCDTANPLAPADAIEHVEETEDLDLQLIKD